MSLGAKTALLACGVALCVSPPIALASAASSNPAAADNQGTQTGAANKPSDADQPVPGATPPANAKAYGRYCQNQSKKHIPGEKGTPFSQCVTAMAKVAKDSKTSPKAACAGLSKKHVAGQKGTPFSNCVVAAARLRNDKQKNP